MYSSTTPPKQFIPAVILIIPFLLLISTTCNLPLLVGTQSPRPTESTPTHSSTKSAPTRTRTSSTVSPPLSTQRAAQVESTSLTITSVLYTQVTSIDVLLATCPSNEEINRFHDHFDISFDPDLNFPPYACQDGNGPDGGVNPRLVIYQTLRAISALRFLQPLPWTSGTLYQWLQEAISGILITSTDFSYCCDKQNRIVLKADLLSQPEYASWYTQNSIGLMDFAGLIAHEARHAEIGGHTWEGTGDETLEEMGAWGVQYYFFFWIAEWTPSGMFNAPEIQAASSRTMTALDRICSP